MEKANDCGLWYIGPSIDAIEEEREYSPDEVIAYISGSFCVSIIAAIGIPKFDAGPQKSVGCARILSVPVYSDYA